jgi:AcrR family transcriptional regulator
MGSKRAAILEAATWLFATKGYGDASTTDLARITGSAEGTVFYHFESKEKLFLAALEDVKNTVEHAFADFREVTAGAPGLEVLESAVRLYLQLASDNEAQFMLLHRRHAYELAETNDECRSLLETVYEQFVGAIEHAIRRGQSDGSMAPLPVHRTALLVYMTIDGLVRFKHYNLYDAGSLFEDLLAGCRRLVAERHTTR